VKRRTFIAGLGSATSNLRRAQSSVGSDAGRGLGSTRRHTGSTRLRVAIQGWIATSGSVEKAPSGDGG